MARRGRVKKSHGWDLRVHSNSVTLGAGSRPYMIEVLLQEYIDDIDTLLVRELDPFYCERIILDIYPYLNRVNDNDAIPLRIWQWALVVVNKDWIVDFLSSTVTSINDVNIYTNGNDILEQASRVLQQGNEPCYDNTVFGQEALAGPLTTGATGPFYTSIPTIPFGPERVSVDLSTKFSLRDGEGLYLLVGPSATPDWEDGDQLSFDVFYKGLWTKRRQ